MGFGSRTSVKESYQEIEDKNEDLRDYLATYRDKGQEFLDRYEMSWIYHDSVGEQEAPRIAQMQSDAATASDG